MQSIKGALRYFRCGCVSRCTRGPRASVWKVFYSKWANIGHLTLNTETLIYSFSYCCPIWVCRRPKCISGSYQKEELPAGGPASLSNRRAQPPSVGDSTAPQNPQILHQVFCIWPSEEGRDNGCGSFLRARSGGGALILRP